MKHLVMAYGAYWNHLCKSIDGEEKKYQHLPDEMYIKKSVSKQQLKLIKYANRAVFGKDYWK